MDQVSRDTLANYPEEWRYSTNKGASAGLYFFPNTSKENAPVCLLYPAMGVKAIYYQDFAAHLSTVGFHVACIDLLGHGSSSIRPSRQVNFSYWDLLEQNYNGAYQAIKARFPHSPMYLMGHSLGGQIAALHLSLHPKRYQGLILVASCSVYYKGWQGWEAWAVLALTQMAPMISQLVGYFPGHQLGFAGKEARGVIKDWSRNARTGLYRLDKTAHNFEQSLGQIKHPILVLGIAGDRLAPPAAIANLHRKFAQAKVDYQSISPQMANVKRLSHFSWVRQPQYFVQNISNWLEKT
ncbi:MAG: alpha/beta fold hydrolase [Bacteroidota bacterium]